MRTVDIGIGHDDNLMIAQLADVWCLRVFFCSDGHAKRTENVGDFLIVENLMLHRLFNVKNLTAQRKDGLMHTVTAHLCRTACRVSLDDKQFAILCRVRLTVGQFARQSATAKRRLALDAHTGLVGCLTRTGCKRHLLHDGAGLLRMLLKIYAQRLADCRLNGSDNLVVAEFCLCLTLELRLQHFYRNNRCQSFTEIGRIDCHLLFLKNLGVVGIFLQRRRQSAAETRKVRTALDGVDIVDKRIYILVERCIVSKRHLHRDALALGVDINDVVDKMLLRLVDIADKLLQALR